MDWKPIATAPRNKAIMVHLPNMDYYGNDGVYCGMLVDMGTGPHWLTFAWAMGRDIGADEAPSAWAEMPAAPSDAPMCNCYFPGDCDGSCTHPEPPTSSV